MNLYLEPYNGRRPIGVRVPECVPDADAWTDEWTYEDIGLALCRCAVEDWLVRQWGVHGDALELSSDGGGVLLRAMEPGGNVEHSWERPTVHEALVAAAHWQADGMGVPH
jgi:hypothetical protein